MTRRKSKVAMSVLLLICMLLNTVSSALADGAGVVTTKNVNLNKTSYGGPMAWNGAFGIGLMYESYKDLNGVEQGKKWGRIDGIFDPKETWTVNGDIAYCFDYTVSATPESGTQHRELSSLDELGLSAAVKERALKVAKAADALTKNNYKLLKDNADGIAKAFYHEFIDVTGSTTVQLTPGTANFSKEAIASLIRNGDAKFCRWLVQWMVWTHMNQIQWGVSDAFDGPPGGTVVNPKTGETMTGQPVGALIGLGKVFDFPWMLELGYEAWLKSSSRAEYPYTFYPGESKTISGQEAEDIIGIYNKLGTIAPGYSQITVTKNADGTVTLKCPNSATPVDTDWTNWVTSEKNFAYGSTPYTTGNSSVSAQFIVKPSSYRELRSKVKVNNTYDPVDILLTKIDAETETPIADAEYTVEYFENTTATGTASKKWVFKTDSDGYIKYDDSYKVSGDALLTNPANGFPGFPANSSIKIYESKAPDKYALSDKVFKVKFLLDGGVCLAYDIDTGAAIETVLPDGTKVLNQKDEEPRDKKEVVVKKTSNGPTVEGFKFQLTGTDFSGQNVSITAVTNAQGVASFGVVAHGSYTVKEIDTPSHMSVSPDKKDITIDKSSPNPTTVEFSNTLKNGTVRVKKTVGTVSGANSNGVSLSGFTFRLTGKSTSGATINMVATTDANGIAEFTDVPYGDNYTVSEELTDAQKKYWIPAENKSVSVNGTTIGTAGYVLVEEENEPKTGSVNITKKVPTGSTSDGSGFKFIIEGTSDLGYAYYIEVVTGVGGVATVADVPLGTYSIREELTADQAAIWKSKSAETITVSAEGTPVDFTCTNDPKTTKVELKKISENGEKQGFQFTISGTRAIGGTFSKTASTDANGYINFGEVPYGSYTVKENLTEAQKKIFRDPVIDPASFTLSDTNVLVKVTATNKLGRGGLSIEKADIALDGTPQGDATLAGIRFAVIAVEDSFLTDGTAVPAESVVAVITTNAEGYAETGKSDLAMGKYLVVELRVDDVAEIGSKLVEGTSEYANDSYLWKKNEKSVTLTEYDKIKPVDGGPAYDPPVSGEGSVVKVDATNGTAQGDASFEGIRIAIVNNSNNSVVTGNDVTIAKGHVFEVITLKADGTAVSGKVPYGSYIAYELRSDAVVAVGDKWETASKGTSIYANEHGYLYKEQSQKFSIRTNNEVKTLNFSNDVVRGGVKVEKWDKELGRKVAQGDANFEGINFDIVLKSKNPVWVDGTKYEEGAVVKSITTNAAGDASTGDLDLPYGTYTIQEVATNEGYLLTDGTARTFEIRENGVIVATDTTENAIHFDNNPVRGAGAVLKRDIENTEAQGDANFEGIRFVLVNESDAPVKIGDVEVAIGGVVIVLTADKNGDMQTPERYLPYGTYGVYELRLDAQSTINVGDAWVDVDKGTSIYANEHGYLYKEQSQKFSIRTNNEVKTLNFSNDVVRGGVKVEKWDKELGRKVAQGDANFEGINFDIVLKSKNPVWVDGTKYEEGAVVKSITTNAAGDASTGDLDLPYGTYTIQEVATNEGYLLTDGTARTFEIRENGVIVATDTTENAIHFDNNPVRGAGAVLKRDIENTEAQGDANFEGIRFVLVNESDAPVKIGDVEVAIGGVVIVLTADKNGDMQTPERYLPYGTYGVYELRLDAQSTINVGDAWVDVDKGTSIYANEHGYLYKETNIAPIEIRKDGELVTALEKVENYVARGGVTLSKRDLYTGDTPQGDASFKGIRYAIINRSESAILLPDGKKIEVGQVAAILTTDENGNASTDVRVLPYGTYDAVELRIDDKATVGLELERGSHEMANDYYLWKDLSFEVIVREDGVVYEAKDSAGKDFENEPKEPTNPELYKYDADLGTNKAQGGATFEGIKFALINRSKLPVYVENFDRLFVVGEVIDIIESDANGVIQLGYTLPYGTYGLIELPITTLVKQGDMFDTLDDLTKFGKSKDVLGQYYANASYMYTDRTEKQFKAVTLEDGSVEYDTSLLHFDNKVVRAGIYFEKKIESTQRILPYVLFKITSLDTGEAHYIFLNHNAHYGTDQIDVPHSNNTNGVDAIMAPYEGAGIVPQSIIDQLMEEEAWRWGTWFGEAPIDDNEYALPYGRYLLEEIRSDANKNFVMYFDEFTIWYNYQYRSFGTIFNKEVGLLTSAVDGATGTKEGIAEAGAKIVDTVTYNNLQKKSYTLISTLHVQGEDGKWSQIPGVEVKTEFTAEMPNYYVVVEIPFDASSYENKKVVVFEELIETISGKFVAEHKDYNDAQQTVFYKPAPKVGLSLIKDVVSTPGNGVAYMKGETVKYKITVLNTGELDLYDVDVDDDLVGFSTTIHRLKVGASKEFYTEYVVTEDDVTAEKIHNIATATCEDPTDSPSNPKDPLKAVDDETVPTMPYSPAYIHNKILYSKPGNGIAYIEGETVVYLLYAKNTGNQTLVIDITDELVKFYKTITLEPGQEWSEKVKYVVTAADVEAGKVLNVLSSKGTPTFVPPGEPTDPITPPDVEVEVPTMTWEPSYIHNKVVISTPKNGIAYTEGEVVVYELYVENDGNQPLTITVIDELVGLEEEIKLAPGESWKKQVEYTVTADDVKAGKVVNILTSSGIPPVYPPNVPEEPITPPDIEVEVPTMEENSDYKQTKVVVSTPANGEAYAEGEVVVYEIGLENTGNLPLIIDVVDELVNFE